MELAQINQRIAVVNAESKRLNNERAVNIGKRETLQKQLDEALASYKATYGVDITAETLEAEIARVSSEKIKEVEKIEAMLNLIKTGRYDEVNAIIDEGQAQAQPEQTSSGVVHPTQQASTVTPVTSFTNNDPILGNVGQPVDPSNPNSPTYKSVELSVTPQMPNLGTPVASESVTPQMPNLGTPVVPQPKKPTLSGLDMGVDDNGASHLGVPPMINKPSSPSQPNKPVVTSFNAILGGSAFKPQGEV